MDGRSYLQSVKASFQGKAEIRSDMPDLLIAYEEQFRWQWFATKLKITSFVRLVPEIGPGELETYSAHCLREAIKNSRGLPRGWQNGIVSCNVLASERVSGEAADFALSRPQKHFSAFEAPVIYDLSSGRLHYYTGSIVWGVMYESFIREYIAGHFSLRGQA